MITRRGFLAGTLGLAALPRLLPSALAAPGDVGRRFLFVFAPGGWDPTRVFAPLFDAPDVDLEADAQLGQVGDLAFVDHAGRPAVRRFFERHVDRTAVLNGLVVPSVQHEVCTRLVLTGAAGEGAPDWPALIGSAGSDAYALPHLVLSGPSFPGPHVADVARTGLQGQLDALLSGDLAAASVQPTSALPAQAQGVLDRWLTRRIAGRREAARTAGERETLEAFAAAHAAADRLEEERYTLDFATTGDLLQQAGVAMDALSKGVCRCASLSFDGGIGWDTHTNNDETQGQLFELFFQGLDQIVGLLHATSTPSGTLADDTVLVVLSEMGRTPLLNATLGKDHWPSTSAMLVGPGISGGRVVGGFDGGLFGRPIDPVSGAPTDDGVPVTPKSLGATLARLADADPGPTLADAPVIEALLG